MGVDADSNVDADVGLAQEGVAEDAHITPWRKEVDEYFSDVDSGVRDKIDVYIREKRQPYVTKLEGDRAELADKAAWFDDLEADPDSVLSDAINQKYSPELAEKFLALIDAGAPPDQAAKGAAEDGAAILSPDDRAILDRAKARDDKEALDVYLAEVSALVKDNPHVVPDSFHFYVEKAGDLESALALYNKHFPPPVVPDLDPPLPPATLSGGGGGTPVAKEALTLEELGKAMFDAASGR